MFWCVRQSKVALTMMEQPHIFTSDRIKSLMKGVAIYRRDEGRSPEFPESQPIGVYQDQFDFETLREAILAIAFLASLVSATAFYVTYKYRNERVFRAASRTFMYLYREFIIDYYLECKHHGLVSH
jgi:hypothetical protein